jgi:hypothetical protein
MTSWVLSLIALGVSGISAVFAAIAALSARRLQVIEQSRRLQERRPRLVGEITLGPHPRRGVLSVTLLSDEPLSKLDLVVPVRLAGGSQGVIVGSMIPVLGVPFPIRPRDSRTWRVTISPERVSPGSLVQVEATCTGSRGEVWKSVLIEAEVGPGLP